ncbi:MAG: hypothetical protein K2J80_04350 [Oscillospiraceae bacterium]|nr:hypothetical protein [Oscillospiraceae bacterium]
MPAIKYKIELNSEDKAELIYIVTKGTRGVDWHIFLHSMPELNLNTFVLL